MIRSKEEVESHIPQAEGHVEVIPTEDLMEDPKDEVSDSSVEEKLNESEKL